MSQASSAVRRLSLLGCLLVGAAALALSACGDGAATAESTVATAEHRAEGAVAAAQLCPAKVDVFLRSLNRLRRQLAIGLSYEQYAARMESLESRYRRIPAARLTIGCLVSNGAPAERAFNKYIDAANDWGECLADAACSTASIEPVLQRSWRVASGFLSEAR